MKAKRRSGDKVRRTMRLLTRTKPLLVVESKNKPFDLIAFYQGFIKLIHLRDGPMNAQQVRSLKALADAFPGWVSVESWQIARDSVTDIHFFKTSNYLAEVDKTYAMISLARGVPTRTRL